MAEELVINITGNGTSFSRTISQVEAGIKRAQNATTSFGHSTVSQTQAASASLRLLEGNFQSNIRAVERFVTTIPGVGQALKLAFPLVGGIAFAGLLAKMGEEVYKFIQTTNAIPAAIQKGFNSLNLSSQSTNDALAVTNDKLEDQIAKLEHHSGSNGLKLMLDEAKVAADKLATSLATDSDKMMELMKTNSIGLGGMLLGKNPTADTAGSVNYFNNQLQSLALQKRNALGNGDQAGADAAQKQLDATRQAAIDWGKQKLATPPKGNALLNFFAPAATAGASATLPGDDSANRNIVQGFLGSLYGQQDNEKLTATNQSDQKRLDQLTKAKEAADAARQAIQKQMESYETAYKTGTQDGSINNDYDTISFWEKAEASLRGHGDAYLKSIAEIKSKIAQANGSIILDMVKGGQADRDQSKAVGAAVDEEWERLVKADDESTKRLEQAAKQAFEDANTQIEAAEKLAEAAVKMQLARGQLTEGQAALAMQAIHADSQSQYNDALTTATGANAGITLKQVDEHNGKYAETQQSDQNAIYETSLQGMLAKMSADWDDMTKQIGTTLTSTIGNFNSSFASALTAHAYSGQEYRRGLQNAFSGSLRTGATGLVQTGLQGIEKDGLGSIPGLSKLTSLFGLGGGKKGDSAANPLWVKSADALGSSLSSAAGSIPGLGGVGSALGSALDFIPMLAGGGDVTAGNPYIVGDGGKPELFIPHTNGTVHPDASAALGGSMTHNISIDARGAQDPAATEAAVHRAMGQYMPMAVGASVSAVKEQQARRPLSSVR